MKMLPSREMYCVLTKFIEEKHTCSSPAGAVECNMDEKNQANTTVSVLGYGEVCLTLRGDYLILHRVIKDLHFLLVLP